MSERTITRITNIKDIFDINTNGLGEIIRKKVDEQMPPDDISDDGKTKTVWTKYEHWDLYLKPAIGATISTYEQWSDRSGSTDYDPEFDDDSHIVRHTAEPECEYSNMDIDDEKFFWIHIGHEYYESYTTTMTGNYNDDVKPSETYNSICTTHIEYDSSYTSTVELKVFGTDISGDEDMFFTIIDAGGEQFNKTYILKNNKNEKYALTNIVAYSNENKKCYWIQPSSNIDELGILHEFISCSQLKTKSEILSDNNNNGNGLLHMSSGEEVNGLFLVVNNNCSDDNDKVSTIALYIDSAISILSPYSFKSIAKPWEFYGTDEVVRSTEEKFCNAISIDSSGLISNIKIYDVKLKSKLESDNDDEQDIHEVIDPDTHEWAYLIRGVAKGFIIQYVEKYRNAKISDIVEVICPYARFTGYWAVFSSRLNISVKKILNGEEYINTESDILPWDRNCVLRPIFKPFAEVHLICYCNEAPFGYNFDTSWLKRTYCKPITDKFSAEHIKQFFVKSNDIYDKNINIIYNYIRTISPFKNEFYFVHGGRKQFDKKTWDNMSQSKRNEIQEKGNGIGCSSIWANSNVSLKYVNLRNQHILNSFYNTNYCLGIYGESCFGQGIQQGIQKAGDWNGVRIAGGLPVYTPNTFYSFGSCATHTGMGYYQGESQQSPFIEYALKNSDTYKKVSDTFNNKLMQITSMQYAEIYRFCVNNFDRLVNYWLKSGIPKREKILKKTFQEVLRDILNNGERYFCVEEDDQESGKPVDPASDQRFPLIDMEDWDGDGVNDAYYNPPICDTFIGWLKSKLLGHNFTLDEYYKNPFTDAVPNKYPNDEDAQEIYEQEYISFHGPTPSDSITELKDKLISIQKNSLGTQYGELNINKLDNLCCKPWTGCSGMFLRSDAKMFTNPDKYANSWLTSDNDIKYLYELTTKKDYSDLDLDDYRKHIDDNFRKHNKS